MTGVSLRFPTAAIAAWFILFAQVGLAADGCEVEEWTWKYNGTHKGQAIIRIEGTTTCKDGVVRLRVYDGKNDKLLGVGGTFIRGHTFYKDIFDVADDIESVKVRFDIEDRR